MRKGKTFLLLFIFIHLVLFSHQIKFFRYETSKFLQKVDSLSFNSNSVKSMYTLSWYQGFGLKIEDVNEKLTEFLILLRDRTRTKNFLTFLTSTGNVQLFF